MSRKITILGIHTDIGKTVTAAVMTEALQADYWKPIQAGDLENTDSIKVRRWISNEKSIVHDEAVKLQMAASPHTAAESENKIYDFRKFTVPQTENLLLIETAGGIHSPIDNRNTMLDVIEYFGWEVVLVSKNYLGSINHTLLCLEILEKRNVKPISLIINGLRNNSSESFIQNYSGINNIIHVNELETISQETIKNEARNFKEQWSNL